MCSLWRMPQEQVLTTFNVFLKIAQDSVIPSCPALVRVNPLISWPARHRNPPLSIDLASGQHQFREDITWPTWQYSNTKTKTSGGPEARLSFQAIKKQDAWGILKSEPRSIYQPKPCLGCGEQSNDTFGDTLLHPDFSHKDQDFNTSGLVFILLYFLQ